MLDFKIEYRGTCGDYGTISRVYEIDPARNRFLIVDENGQFKWVCIYDCVLCEE